MILIKCNPSIDSCQLPHSHTTCQWFSDSDLTGQVLIPTKSYFSSLSLLALVSLRFIVTEGVGVVLLASPSLLALPSLKREASEKQKREAKKRAALSVKATQLR
jgi:hypothetical protein